MLFSHIVTEIKVGDAFSSVCEQVIQKYQYWYWEVQWDNV